MTDEIKKSTVTLDGREFQTPTQAITAAQEDYVTGYLGKAGVNDLIAPMVVEIPDDLELQDLRRTQGAYAFLHQIMVSGLKMNVLAGTLTEVGKKWTIAEADKNAEAFRQITDAGEKVLMQTKLVDFVLNFFESSVKSRAISPKFSSPKRTAPDTSKEEHVSSGVTAT